MSTQQAWLRCDLPQESVIPALTTHHLRLRFFDQNVHIQSDSHTLIELFARMYRRFRAKDPPVPTQPPIVFIILTRSDNPWGTPVLVLDGDVWLVPDPSVLEGYACYELLVQAVAIRVRSHICIHAGVVCYAGQGIILAADSRHGKTTLVMELVRRGGQYLSDDVAALGRADRRVHPFPRSLSIRPGTLELIGCPQIAVSAPMWLGKWLVDTEELRTGSMGEAAPISHVIIVRDPAEAEHELPNGPERELGLLVHRLDEAFLTAVKGIAGVRKVRTALDHEFPLLWVLAERRMAVLSQIEVLCREQRILILDVIKRAERLPSFAAPAWLQAIPTSQAVRELLRRFQGGHNSALLQEEFGGRSARLFREVAALVGQARCHQLLVGPLHDMADLVCDLVSPASMGQTGPVHARKA
jgi:hypothetical protein